MQILFKKVFIYLFILMSLVTTLLSCNKNELKYSFDNVEEVFDKNVNIGLQTGSSITEMVEKKFPSANIVFLGGNADLLYAITSGRIDVIAHEEINARYLINENRNLKILEDKNNLLGKIDYAFCFDQDEHGVKLKNEFDEYIEIIKNNGELKKIIDYWSAYDLDESQYVDYESLPNINGVINMYTESQYRPFSFVHYTKLVGIDIELAKRFCEYKGYALNITSAKFESLIPALVSDRCDMVASGISITEERKEAILFSTPVVWSNAVLIVDTKNVNNKNFIDSIEDSFCKTFIKEDRYKLFIEGILTTLMITIMSFIIGSLLGFSIYLLYYPKNAVIERIFDVLVWIFKRLPMVVLLMILYFVVFVKTSISSNGIAIIGFSLVFLTEVFNMLKTNINSIDIGQIEAAKALGYGEIKTLFRILLPQVLDSIMDEYKSGINSLIKSTAVVGYVMVTDLTKVGDIVRSRTYGAYFPIIAVAIIYIILAEILIIMVSLFSKYIEKMSNRKKDYIGDIND